MKKYLLLASALLALVACNKEPIIDTQKPEKQVSYLTFRSSRPQLDAETKTSWNGSTIVWTAETDKIKTGFTFNGDWWGQTAAYSSSAESPNNHKKFYQSDAVDIDATDASVGTFSVPTTFTGPSDNGDFVFYAVYPSTAMADNSQDGAPTVSVTLKSTQTPLSNSFDGSADLMVGKSASINSTGLPSDPIDLTWTRVVAHGLFTLTDFRGVVSGETISKVVFTAQAGANLTGKQSVNIADGTVTASDASNVITLEGANLAFVTEDAKTNLKVWLSVVPVTLSSLNVLVETDKATYVRDITGISKTLKGNACNKLGINMSTATRTPKAEYDWVKKDLSEITSSDIFVIVGNNGSNYAMSNDNGTTNPPSAVAVNVSNNKLASAPAERLQWNLSVSSGSYTFYPNGTTETWLYCNNTNNGVRVGDNDNKVFTLDNSGYLKHTGTNRYVGVYSSQDWRCYTSSTQANIKDQTFAFYVRTESGSSTPTNYAVTWTDPTEAGCSISATVNGDAISSGDVFATGTVVSITATAGSDYEFGGWTVTGATAVDATAATTTFTVGESAVSFSATFNSTVITPTALPFEETFASGQGDFTIDNVALDGLTYVWSHDSSNKYMKASGYASSANHDVESWLVSPLLEIPTISTGETIKLKFTQCINKYFGTVADEANLMVKEEGGSWAKYTITYPALSGNWSSFEEQVVDLSSYAGKNIQFAFKYAGTSSANGTWEIKNVSVKKYEPKVLSSISVSGQTTVFTKDDAFAFGGAVTAAYNDETTADVTASATFTGYNMSTPGEQTVTVSYTESGVTKTTTYTITVNSGDTEAVVYTLDGTVTATGNAYATATEITQNGITWEVMGNTEMNPWRIGGKGENLERTVYSTTALNKNISKIEITHGTASNITVNSMTVIVSKNANFSNPVSTLTPTFVASGVVTVNRPDGADWSNCYYKIVYNVSVSGNSNRFIQFTKAEFTGK